jgi:hypothetical protein
VDAHPDGDAAVSMKYRQGRIGKRSSCPPRPRPTPAEDCHRRAPIDIVAFIDGLQDQALVVRERDQRDRGRQILTISASGKRLLRKVEGMDDKAEPDCSRRRAQRARRRPPGSVGPCPARPRRVA